jgi:hypothetical protein
MSPMVDGDILPQVPASDFTSPTLGKKRGFSMLRGGLCEIAVIRPAATEPKTEHAAAPTVLVALPPLLDVRQDSVELVEAVVTHDQLAFAAGRMLDGHFRAKLICELLLEALDVRVPAVLALGG